MKYTITIVNNKFQINKWSNGAEKYVPCTFKNTRKEAEDFITRALAVR